MSLKKTKKSLSQWQLYLHYLLLATGTIVLLIPAYEKLLDNDPSIPLMIAFTTVAFLVLDQFIHFILRETTGWDD